MSIADQLLAAFLLYGLPVLFGVTVVSAFGLPLPDGLMLITAGSFIKQGDMQFWPALLVSILAAVLGDQIGYFLGRQLGPRLIARLSRKLGEHSKIKKAEEHMKRWGGLTVFLSRWLVTALGPWVNFTCGFTGYSWPRFLVLAVVGDVVWASYNLLLGYAFSDQVEEIGATVGSVTWIVLGLLVAAVLVWWLVQGFRPSRVEAQTPGNTDAGNLPVGT